MSSNGQCKRWEFDDAEIFSETPLRYISNVVSMLTATGFLSGRVMADQN